MAKERTVEDIRADLAQTRKSLQETVSDLRESLKPKNMMRKGADEVKDFAKAEYESVKEQFVKPNGRLRTKRVLAVAGAVAGTVVFLVVLNNLSNRRQIGVAKRKAITAA